MFSIALHQFGALLSLNRRTPFPSIPYTFGTVFAQYRGVAVRSNPALTPAKRRSFAPIQSTLPSIRITQRRLKQLEAIHLVRQQREHGKQDLAFHARPFVLCGLPPRRLPSDQLAYLRRNGKIFLQLVAHPQFGLPFGHDRLIPIWMATIAVRQRSRVVPPSRQQPAVRLARNDRDL